MFVNVNWAESANKRWQQLIERDKQLKDIAKVHTDLVELMEKHIPRVEPLTMEEEEMKSKLSSGTPLLEGLEDQMDLRFAVSLFRELTDWKGTGDEKKTFRKWVKKLSDQEIEQGLRSWTKGDLEVFQKWTVSSEVPQDLLYALIQYSLLPTLHAYGETLLAHKHLLEHWNRGYCPVCGDSAGLGELREAERFRYLRCMSCGGDWPYKRIACHTCGNDHHETLYSYLIEDPKTGGRYQVDACEDCKAYLKVSNKLQPSSPPLLLLDDLVTTHLDLFAVEHGYCRGGKPDKHTIH